MDIALLCRSHFLDLPDAKAEHVASNVWKVRVALNNDLLRKSKRGKGAEDWDGAVFSLDGVEAEPATGSGEGEGFVEVTVLLFA